MYVFNSVLYNKLAGLSEYFATDLKIIYQAATEEQGQANMKVITEKWQGKYPNAMKS